MWCTSQKIFCVNLIAFLGVYEKTKDTLEARQELQRMEEWDALHPENRDNGWHYLSPASYTLSKEEKECMFECLSSIMVPSWYSSNIKGILNLAEKKLINLKSHDCHVLTTELLPVVLRGILPDNVRLTIVELCAFLNAVSEGNWPGQTDKAAKWCGAMPCWLWADISTIFLQHHDTSSSAPCERDWYPWTSISTQHIPIRKVHGGTKAMCL